MKKLSYFLSISAMAALVTFSACKKTEDKTVEKTCADETYPVSTGLAVVKIMNLDTTLTINTITAKVGEVLTLPIKIEKGDQRPQKLVLYQTDCVNKLGDVVSVTGQQKANSAGTEIDLRNQDIQVRTVEYTVPSGMDPVYVTIEINEASGKNTHKRLQINVSNSGIIDSYTGLLLGAQSATEPSRMIAATGQTFTTCNAAASIDLVDVTYANGGADTKHYLGSNASRFDSGSPFYVGTTTTYACGDDGNLTIGPGSATYFQAGASADFDNATNTTLSAVSFTGITTQYIEVTAVGNVVIFKNAKGKIGVAKVTALTAPTGPAAGQHTGKITLSVKIQR